MKKFLTTATMLILSLVISLTTLGGCNLVTTDNERDMNQVVATVQIEKGAPKEEILKQDLVMAYFNFGYMYEQYYGYTREQTFNLIISNIINTRVHLQNAMKVISSGAGVSGNVYEDCFVNQNVTDVWDVERYLTDSDLLDAKYSTYKDFNELIDSYEDHNHGDKVGDTMIGEVRATPANAATEEEELTDAEKQEYIEKGIAPDASKKAQNKVINVLENNGLLGSDYKGEFTQTDYYAQTYKNYCENALLEIYEDAVKTSERKKITYADIQQAYLKEYNKQQEWSNEEFIAALDAASATAPILYSNNGTYGFVYNLLLGANSDQTSEIGDITVDNPNITDSEKATLRRDILADTTVKDLRSTWVLSNYNFDLDTKTFTGDYSFTSEGNRLAFQGEVVHLNAGDEDDEHYEAEYGVTSVKEFALDEFITFMEEYVYGATKTGEATTDPSIYKVVNADTALSEYDQRIQDLLFAFSTDAGSLNTFEGYAIKPTPDVGENETYMIEFAKAGRQLLEMGGNSYIMAATDYGYHVMFFSEVYKVGQGYATLDDYLNAQYSNLGVTDWSAEFTNMVENFADYEHTDTYLYYLFNSIATTSVDKALNDINNEVLIKYVYGSSNAVVKYPDTYKDLLG